MFHARTLALAAITLFASSSLCAQSGSIKTTDVNGNAVNGNTYTAVEDVYVSQSGLPDGTYYFQVTNSNGSVLASTDPIENRTFTVANGVIPTANNVVQLAPFTLIPDTYKVWVTSQTAYASNNNSFAESDSKTDNFSILQCTITGTVFYDTNQANCLDPGEPGLAGWRVELRKENEATLLQVDFTDANGQYKFVVPLDDTGATKYVIKVLAPVFKLVVDEFGEPILDANGNKQYELVADRADGFIGESQEARWLASPCPNAPVIPNAEFVAGPNFGNIWFVPVDTRATSQTAVYNYESWASKDGKARIDECRTTKPGLWPNILNELPNPWAAGSRPSAPASYGAAFTGELFKNAANACLAADSAGTGGTGYLRNKRGTVFVVEGRDFNKEFFAFSKWLSANPEGHQGFALSREVATALLNIHCGNLADKTLYIKTGNGLNLVSFDHLVYKAVCLFLAPENGRGINDTGHRAEGDWLTLRNAIIDDLAGTDPYPLDLRLGQEQEADWHLHPLLRPRPNNLVRLKLLVPSLTKQFSQINTTTEPTEDTAYVWEPEEDVDVVPEPAEPYEQGIG
ncbi:MAG: hypothetical protein ACYTGW_21000 [Planctomycetota bacterium]|jgi:hypothetical protein